MVAYFRYLSLVEVTSYLYQSSYDLAVAIAMVRRNRFVTTSPQQPPLVPDGGKIKAALRAAATEAQHPEPDVLAGFMTDQYPSDHLRDVIDTLQRCQQLDPSGVERIRSLLRRRWPPKVQAKIELNMLPNAPRNTDSTGSSCDNGQYLKMSLLDTIHAFYIKALAKLPNNGLSRRILRALLVAGHCYGPLDAVSNIILSSVWYDMAFPSAYCEEGELSRLGSCSLNGMLAITRAAVNCSEHEALIYLKQNDCNLSHVIKDNVPFAAATEAANHPQQAAFASFLVFLSTEMRTYLHSVLAQPGRMSDAHWTQLNTFLRDEVRVLTVKKVDLDVASSSGSIFAFASFSKDSPQRDYKEDTEARILFFAELWGPSSFEDIGLKPSSCTPLTDYFAHTDPSSDRCQDAVLVPPSLGSLPGEPAARTSPPSREEVEGRRHWIRIRFPQPSCPEEVEKRHCHIHAVTVHGGEVEERWRQSRDGSTPPPRPEGRWRGTAVGSVPLEPRRIHAALLEGTGERERERERGRRQVEG
ncbi:hypothetical protein PR202_ga07578 [Eleusine coracana subsp. coracana]|uniref:PIR2-like helical domain-containing protein n=1 Tax=Eleusine coracana subsp. coracana TaxID=191504 RepID=A0AAV5BZ16_ELECO|nr:hypothetical protein PR202_ga07578 [Eleusine coracana subsp. coracana]